MALALDDTILAIFTPTLMTGIPPVAQRDIGKRGHFVAAWRIEAGEPYAGQFAMVPTDDTFHFSWCPEEDLTPL